MADYCGGRDLNTGKWFTITMIEILMYPDCLPYLSKKGFMIGLKQRHQNQLCGQCQEQIVS